MLAVRTLVGTLPVPLLTLLDALPGSIRGDVRVKVGSEVSEIECEDPVAIPPIAACVCGEIKPQT